MRWLHLLLFVIVFSIGSLGCKGDLDSNRECLPECGQKECGSDGCGGFCGQCGPGDSCSEAFQCIPSFCGNGEVDPGESCDSAITEGVGSCPLECPDDGNTCTQESLFGFPETCDVACRAVIIIDCNSGDGCCPGGCSPAADLDCSMNCDNGVIDELETCDPPSSCPTEADCVDTDPCTIDSLTGFAASCSAACANIPITEDIDGDGCCLPGSDSGDDDDCMSNCGDGVVEGNETCDNAIDAGMPGACTTDCEDNNGCTDDTLSGDPDQCSALCVNTVLITDLVDGDSCCPTGGTPSTDSDCVAVCDNGTIELGETCDPISSCPTTCNDNDACTTDTLGGVAAMCTAECAFDPITACGAVEGCCPATCSPAMDADCTDLCTQMCDLADTNCAGVYPYTDRNECDTLCAAYVSGNAADVTGNNIYCRINQLTLAANDDATYCPEGGQASTVCQ